MIYDVKLHSLEPSLSLYRRPVSEDRILELLYNKLAVPSKFSLSPAILLRNLKILAPAYLQRNLF